MLYEKCLTYQTRITFGNPAPQLMLVKHSRWLLNFKILGLQFCHETHIFCGLFHSGYASLQWKIWVMVTFKQHGLQEKYLCQIWHNKSKLQAKNQVSKHVLYFSLYLVLISNTQTSKKKKLISTCGTETILKQVRSVVNSITEISMSEINEFFAMACTNFARHQGVLGGLLHACYQD